MLNVWLRTFALDDKVHILLLLALADFVFGVAAALKLGTFRLSYVADFLRNDILQKLVPYFALYALALVAGGTDIVIPGLDFGVVAGAAYVGFVAAMVASVLNSFMELGLPGQKLDLKTAIAGSENAAPPKD